MTTLLVVEDNPDLRSALVEVLTDEGYSVLSAENGEEALQVLSGVTVEAILLDLEMPFMDGREFLRRRVKSPELSAIPVVVLSAWVERVPTPTATRILTKPATIEAILGMLHDVLGTVRPALRLVRAP
jgi:two-component system, chemotaxis family, chemotaxis protein CheY